MLSILGVGHAYPSNIISDEFLQEIAALHPGGSNAEAELSSTIEKSAVHSRRTVVPLDYLKATANRDPCVLGQNCEIKLLESPTELGVRAAQLALERAGIGVGAVGLLLGESSTPSETTPSESQRLGSRLGSRAPSFDLACMSASLSLFVTTISKFKENKLPDYILCVSTQTPTARINYAKGQERAYLSDGAAAVVLSARHEGVLKLHDCGYQRHTGAADEGRIEVFGHVHLPMQALTQSFCSPEFEAMLKRLDLGSGRHSASNLVLSPQFPHSGPGSLAELNRIFEKNQLVNLENPGYCLGATALCVLSENWDRLKARTGILLVESGLGRSLGYCIF